MGKYYRTYMDIDLDAIRRNIRNAKQGKDNRNISVFLVNLYGCFV